MEVRYETSLFFSIISSIFSRFSEGLGVQGKVHVADDFSRAPQVSSSGKRRLALHASNRMCASTTRIEMKTLVVL